MRWTSVRAALLAVAVTTATAIAGATPAFAADTGSITGHLTTDVGDPVGSATVYAYTAETWEFAGNATTDEGGAYTIEDMPAGSYLLEFMPVDRPGQFYDNKPWIHQADPVTVVAGQAATVDEDLEPIGFVTGALLGADGNPLVDRPGSASATHGGSSPSGRTDADGRYRIAVTPGDYLVSFEPYGDGTQNAVRPGQGLRRGRPALHGRVRAGHGRRRHRARRRQHLRPVDHR